MLHSEELYIEYLWSLLTDGEKEAFELQKASEILTWWSQDYKKIQRGNHSVVGDLNKSVRQFDPNTLEGAIASLFVYHQLLEEDLYGLICIIRYYLDIKLWPSCLYHKSIEKASYAALIGEIKSAPYFDDRNKIIEVAETLGSIRNTIAHNLVKTNSLERIKTDLDSYLTHYHMLQELLFGEDGDDSIGAWSDFGYLIVSEMSHMDFQIQVIALLEDILLDRQHKILSDFNDDPTRDRTELNLA